MIMLKTNVLIDILKCQKFVTATRLDRVYVENLTLSLGLSSCK